MPLGSGLLRGALQRNTFSLAVLTSGEGSSGAESHKAAERQLWNAFFKKVTEYSFS